MAGRSPARRWKGSGEALLMYRIRITQADLHPHLWARMHQRGITLEEIEQTLNEG